MKPLALTLIAAASTLAAFTSFGAQAGPYHRFWRGTKLPSLSAQQFQDGLNEKFIAQTIQIGSGNGLVAYQPVLLEGASDPSLPDEVALVSYESQDAYNTMRSTPEGQAYSQLHWQYFEKSSKLSLAPVSYSGEAAIEQAYDLHPSFDSWMNASTHLEIHFRAPAETTEAYLARVKTELDGERSSDDAEGRIVLVADGYWLEYVAGADPVPRPGIRRGKSSAPQTLIVPLPHEPAESAKLAPGRGVDVQF